MDEMTFDNREIRVLDDGEDAELWRGLLSDFIEANPNLDEDWDKVSQTIRREGRCWIGGGASPLFYLMPAA